MRGTVNWWAGWSILLVVSYRSLLRVGHKVATLLDSTRKSILALRYNFWRLQGTQSCRGRPVLICILALSLVFTPYLSNTVVSAKSPHFFHALVALKLLVSLISCLVACSARIVVDRQTDRQTKQTHRPTTVTLAAHARRGLITGFITCIYDDQWWVACVLQTGVNGEVKVSFLHPNGPSRSFRYPHRPDIL